MARNETSNLKITVSIDQATRQLKVLNTEFDKVQQKTTTARSSTDQLKSSIDRTGTSATTAAVNFQTMSQGMLNLSTTGIQTWTSLSNLDRAANRLAQTEVGVARAQDLLNNKQIRYDELVDRGLGQTKKAIQLHKELGTAKADLAVKTDKLRIEEGALLDVQLLFAANIANVVVSSLQTIKTMKDLNIASTIALTFKERILGGVILSTGKSATIASGPLAAFSSTLTTTSKAATGASFAIRGVTFSVRGLLRVLGPLAAVFVAWEATMLAWENNWGGFRDAMQDTFPFLRDLTKLQTDARETIEDTTTANEALAGSYETLEKKASGSLTRINEMQVKFLQQSLAHQSDLKNYVATLNQISSLTGGAKPSGFSTGAVGAPTSRTITGGVSTVVSTGVSSGGQTSTQEKVKRSGVVQTEPSSGGTILDSPKFKEAVANAKKNTLLQKIPSGFRDLSPEDRFTAASRFITSKNISQRNIAHQLFSTLNITTTGEVKAFEGGFDDLKRKDPFEISSIDEMIKSSFAIKEAMIKGLPEAERNEAINKMKSGLPTGIKGLDMITSEISQLITIKVIEREDTKLDPSKPEELRKLFTDITISDTISRKETTEELRRKTGFSKGFGLVSADPSDLTSGVLLPSGRFVKLGGRVTEKEKKKLANVKTFFDKQMREFDFGTNTGMQRIRGSSLFGLSQRFGGIGQDIAARQFGLKTPEEQVRLAESQRKRNLSQQQLVLRKDIDNFGQVALSLLNRSAGIEGITGQGGVSSFEVRDGKVVSTVSKSARQAMSSAESMFRAMWHAEQKIERTKQAGGGKPGHIMRWQGGNVLPEFVGALQSIDAKLTEDIAMISAHSHKSTSFLVDWANNARRLAEREAIKIVTESNRKRDERREFATGVAAQIEGLTTEEAIAIARDPQQGRQTLTDMLNFSKRVNGMSQGVVT